MAEPPKVWVKVNAAVDAGVAEIVSLLNEIPGLQTIDSCQGEPGKAPAHVFFYYQDWRITGAFLFEVLAPRVKGEGADVLVSLEVSNGSRPLARLQFAAEAAPSVAAAIRSTVQGRR